MNNRKIYIREAKLGKIYRCIKTGKELGILTYKRFNELTITSNNKYPTYTCKFTNCSKLFNNNDILLEINPTYNIIY
jgi:hypothetical protein